MSETFYEGMRLNKTCGPRWIEVAENDEIFEYEESI